MKIQFNTDKTISGSEREEQYFTSLIEGELKNFESYITRVEVHLSDENGEKDGVNDIKCILETRLEGKKPIAVSSKGDTIEIATSAAIDKLKASLNTIVGKLKEH